MSRNLPSQFAKSRIISKISTMQDVAWVCGASNPKDGDRE